MSPLHLLQNGRALVRQKALYNSKKEKQVGPYMLGVRTRTVTEQSAHTVETMIFSVKEHAVV